MMLCVLVSVSKTEFNPCGSHGGSPRNSAAESFLEPARPSPPHAQKFAACNARPADRIPRPVQTSGGNIHHAPGSANRANNFRDRAAGRIPPARAVSSKYPSQFLCASQHGRAPCRRRSQIPATAAAFEPAPVFQPHVDGDVINRRRFVRGDEDLRFLQTAPDAFAAGADEVIRDPVRG